MLPNRFAGLSWTGPEPEAARRLRRLGWTMTGQDCTGQGGVLLAVESWMPSQIVGMPPYRTLVREGGALVAETDQWGLGHVFVVEQGQVAAFASSATLLAQLFALEPDVDALMEFALFGTFTGVDSPFRGVVKLAAGHRARAEAGVVTRTHWFTPQPARQDLATAFVDAVARMNAAMPNADLELSGGLDSRLILAAMPPAERVRHLAITLGDSTSGDVRVAAALAEKEGLRHRIRGMGDLGALDADGLEALLRNAALGYDHGANPVDKAPLVQAAAESAARFGGQNGEILRGFYYPGQPIQRQPESALAERLIDWRLISNDRVLPRLFDADAYAAHRARARERMRVRLMGYGGSWGETLDRFYLDERMQRWVGISCGNRFVERTQLYPFFDPAVVAAAMALPPAEKANSRAAYRLLATLDPSLAEIPLDNGVIPARPTRGLFLTGAKLFAKVRQRFGGRARATLGSPAVITLWHRQRLFERLDRQRLEGYGIFDRGTLDAVLRGELVPDRATLGFLVMLSGIKEALVCEPR